MPTQRPARSPSRRSASRDASTPAPAPADEEDESVIKKLRAPNNLLLQIAKGGGNVRNGRPREPLYLAVRLWALKLDQKELKAEAVFRVFMCFRPRDHAKEILEKTAPAPATRPRIASVDDAWTEQLMETLPSLAVFNGKDVTDEKEKREFFRLSDAKYLDPNGEEADLWFPDDGRPEFDGNVAMVTYMLTASDIQLDMNFQRFPYDKHVIDIRLFLPKKHKDRAYEFVCAPNLLIRSENIKPTTLPGGGGKGIYEVKDAVSKSLYEWTLDAPELLRADGPFGAESDQSAAIMRLTISRKPRYYVNKFIKMPFLFACLACTSTIFGADDLGNRFTTAFTLLLTLTGISYSASDALPSLPYSTSLDYYQEMCHYFVLAIIVGNILFYYYYQLCNDEMTVCPAAAAAAAAEAAAEAAADAASAVASAAMASVCAGAAEAEGACVASAVNGSSSSSSSTAELVSDAVAPRESLACAMRGVLGCGHRDAYETAAMVLLSAAWLAWNVHFRRQHGSVD